jgi:hypothetical protein
MTQQSKFLTVNPGVMADDNDLCHVLKASNAYGGITVIRAFARTGIVGTLDLVLMNYGTSGTVAGSTVGHMSGGTATVWAVATPQELTLSTTAADKFIAANEWLVLKKVESAATNDLSTEASVMIEYVDGVLTSN